MPRTRGGDKRSSWQTFARRLCLVRRLMCGPADSSALIAAARDGLGAEIYPPDAATALRHDIVALRSEFGCAIRYLPDTGYLLDDLGDLALLDLPDAELETLGFLAATFAETTLPNAPQVAALLDRVVALLPAARRSQFQRLRPEMALDLPQSHAAPRQIPAGVRRALGQQQLAFAYRSSYQLAPASVLHRVAPYQVILRDGHAYLDAFCFESDGQPRNKYTLYRIDRMVEGSVEVLPQRLPPGPPPRRTYLLRYYLSPAVAAQRDIAAWFPESSADFAADGSAMVTAWISDLWQARQVLLRYREHCRVLEPPELIAMLRESIECMAAMYAEQPTPHATAQAVAEVP